MKISKVHLYSYRPGSKSAQSLCKALGIRRIKQIGSRYKGKPNRLIINWGSSNLPEQTKGSQVLNNPEYISLASNKLSFFQKMKEWNEENEDKVRILPFYLSKEEVVASKEYEEGKAFFARTVLEGHSGKGIVEFDKDSKEIPEAKLYTRYIPKDQEYRVHVMGEEAFYVQRKARKLDVPDEQVNWRVRNHANGFIFQKDDFVIPEGVKEEAIKAVEAVGLDFGAVDILTTKKGKVYVLEVNTAPGLEGTTLEKYVEQFQKVIV